MKNFTTTWDKPMDFADVYMFCPFFVVSRCLIFTWLLLFSSTKLWKCCRMVSIQPKFAWVHSATLIWIAVKCLDIFKEVIYTVVLALETILKFSIILCFFKLWTTYTDQSRSGRVQTSLCSGTWNAFYAYL